jgi:hypothetical protein
VLSIGSRVFLYIVNCRLKCEKEKRLLNVGFQISNRFSFPQLSFRSYAHMKKVFLIFRQPYNVGDPHKSALFGLTR